jgi:OmpA-OmpF porin, OOP family
MRTLWRQLAVLFFTTATLSSASATRAQDDFDDDFGRPVRQAPTPAPAVTDDDPFGPSEPREPVAPSSETREEPTEPSHPASAAAAKPAARGEGRIIDDEDPARRRRFHRHSTIFGPVGGIHVVDAGTGAAGTFRVGLNFGVFKQNGFIADGDQARHSAGVLSLSYTPIKQLELFASVAAWATSNLAGSPSLLQVLGDTLIGVKGVWEPKPFITFGGDARVSLLNRLGEVGLVGAGTSFGFRTNLSFDLRGLDKPKPLVIRWNTGYWFDNSIAVVSDVERARRDSLAARPGGISPIEAQDHLVNSIERFGLQLNRTDFVDLALGLELPFEPKDRVMISPILEWMWRIPVNRRGFDCLYVTDADGGLAAGYESCLDVEGVKAFPMTVAAGIRLEPKVRGLAFLVAGEVGVLGSRTIVRELAPTAPWMVRVGGSYAFDPNREVTREIERVVEKEVEVEVAIEQRARIRGVAIESGSEIPVDGAIVRFPGRALTPLVTEAGSFTTYLFEPGDVELAITHPDYEPGFCRANIPAPPPPAAGEAPSREERIVEVRCELVAKPRLGTMALRIVSEQGASISGATVTLSGPAERTLSSGSNGELQTSELPPGAYQVKVESPDYLIKQEEREVFANQTTSATIALVKRPKKASALIRGKQISILRKINFATNSAEILESSDPLLAEVADVLLRNPDVRLVEIQGHTDDRGGADHNLRLSQSRAESVRDWLIRHGVEPGRLTARGFGLTKPLVPNITSSNRARNRRVEFVIMER